MKQLQELAEFLRNAAYADNQTHYIDWSLYVLHPKTNDGDIGFSGGLWTHNRVKELKHHISLHFNYSDTKGITDVQAWRDRCQSFNHIKTMPFDKFKATVIDMFKIEELYNYEGTDM